MEGKAASEKEVLSEVWNYLLLLLGLGFEAG